MPPKSNAASAFQRNLAAINFDEDETEDKPLAKTPPSVSLSNYAVKQIPFDLLEPNRFQTQLRPETLNQVFLEELAANMVNNGFTSVILVRPHPDKPGHYELGHGHRRLAALKLAVEDHIENNKVRDWNKIPARIMENVSDAEWLDIAVSENLSREDITPLAIANSFQAIRQFNPGISLAEIARKVGRSKSWVQRRDAINNAPQHLIDMIREKPDSIEHLFFLKSNISDEKEQRALARQVMEGKLTLESLKEIIKDKKQLDQIGNNLPKLGSRKRDFNDTVMGTSSLARLLNRLELGLTYIENNLARTNYLAEHDDHTRLEELASLLNEMAGRAKVRDRKK